MQKKFAFLAFAIVFVAFCTSNACSENQFHQRFKQARESTVRILVNDIPAGTGFAVTSELIATNFHVVQHISPGNDGQTQISYSSNIKVQLADKRELRARPHPSVLEQGFRDAVGKDIVLLAVPINDLRPVKLGRFADIKEGDAIYLVGFPLGIEHPIIASGIFSTKWKTKGYLGQGDQRDVAWLDITMNKGNSGGPVFLIADDPAQDTVIGVANFNLNPFSHDAENFAKVAANFPGNIMMMGINFKEFSILIGKALASQTHGVGGCIAIDNLRLP